MAMLHSVTMPMKKISSHSSVNTFAATD